MFLNSPKTFKFLRVAKKITKILSKIVVAILSDIFWSIVQLFDVKRMIRRLVHTLVENSLQPYQHDYLLYPSPFTQKESFHFNWIAAVSPCFPLNARNISILTEPQEFYKVLLEKCGEAENRITLASLYLGNGPLEQTLVNTVLANKNFTNGSLQVNILLDYTRGSRYQNNSRTILKPLLEKHEHNCQFCLYHTPILRGLTKTIMPNRWNELFGLQHMKLYIFDDTLIISGANLSNDYFTNRQDRYFVINDKRLTDFYCGLVDKVQSFSLKMDKNDKLSLNKGWQHLPYKGNMHVFVEKAAEIIKNYLLEAKEEQNEIQKDGYDTWIFPLIQMGQLGIQQDAYVTKKLIAKAPENSKIYMATGYFNLTEDYMDTIVDETKAECHLLMAHPLANGFHGASGAAGGIPDAYSLIAKKFKEKVDKLRQSYRIKFYEYLRDGWTYHAKGLWFYSDGSDLPCFTLIGSPNFGERSVKRDLETQLAIVTENEDFQNQLHDECNRLYKYSMAADLNRTIPKWVYAVVYFCRNFF